MIKLYYTIKIILKKNNKHAQSREIQITLDSHFFYYTYLTELN